MKARLLALLVAAILGSTGLVGCADSGTSDGPPAPSGGYDAKGFPLDEDGDVSSNPDDYKETICGMEFAKEAPDYEEECE
jgi:hypothetical protein